LCSQHLISTGEKEIGLPLRKPAQNRPLPVFFKITFCQPNHDCVNEKTMTTALCSLNKQGRRLIPSRAVTPPTVPDRYFLKINLIDY
jgi:hypothetical protein